MCQSNLENIYLTAYLCLIFQYLPGGRKRCADHARIFCQYVCQSNSENIYSNAYLCLIFQYLPGGRKRCADHARIFCPAPQWVVGGWVSGVGCCDFKNNKMSKDRILKEEHILEYQVA